MTKNQNRHNSIAAEYRREKSQTKEISVLFIIPKSLSEQESIYLGQKYSEQFSKENTIESQQIKLSNKIPSFLKRSLSKFLFLAKIIEKIRSYSHLHILYLESLSFYRDILPIFILGKFFSKKIVFEHYNFNDYYLFDDIGIIKKRILKFSDRIIVPSNSQKQALLKRKFPAIYTPPVLGSVPNEQRIIKSVQPKILVNAHLEEIFNFQCLTKAFQLVKQKYPRAELIIKGSGRLKGNMIRTVSREKMQGIQFDNSVKYDDVDLYINCYHIEYFSIKLLEAMAHGIPVISTPIGLIDDLSSKKNILMYQFNDASTLTDHILSLIEQPELTEPLSVESYKFSREFQRKCQKRKMTDLYSSIR